jgi:hypothetical protein
MVRKVRCNETQQTGYSVDFYKASDGKYYKDKDTYLQHVENIKCRNKIQRL